MILKISFNNFCDCVLNITGNNIIENVIIDRNIKKYSEKIILFLINFYFYLVYPKNNCKFKTFAKFIQAKYGIYI